MIIRISGSKHHANDYESDEGDKVTVTHKSAGTGNYQDETETTVGSYDVMCEIFTAIGLEGYTKQETKRETWHFKNVEVVLDEWPWVKTFIEIEGPDETSIRNAAEELGFAWSDGKYGPAETVYRAEYPKMTEHDVIGEMPVLTFDGEMPDWLKERS